MKMSPIRIASLYCDLQFASKKKCGVEPSSANVFMVRTPALERENIVIIGTVCWMILHKVLEFPERYDATVHFRDIKFIKEDKENLKIS